MSSSDEAKSTKLDLFYDDDSSLDCRMVTVPGLEAEGVYRERDFSYMICVTHDEALGERINSVWQCWWDGEGKPLDLSGLDLLVLPSCDRDCHATLIVSHPHGQLKKITVGQEADGERPTIEYNAATCPGSSGAPVFRIYPHKCDYNCLWLPSVHSGSFTSTSTQHQDQLSLFTRFAQELRRDETKKKNSKALQNFPRNPVDEKLNKNN